MPSSTSGQVPSAAQPRARDYGFDIERALSAVVGLHSTVPQDAFTAETLGVERAGNGVLIGDGLVLTIGYLVMEAETVWIHLHDDRVVQGHVLGIDSESGFGLVQALEEIDIAPLPLGDSDAAKVGDRIVVRGVHPHLLQGGGEGDGFSEEVGQQVRRDGEDQRHRQGDGEGPRTLLLLVDQRGQGKGQRSAVQAEERQERGDSLRHGREDEGHAQEVT